MIAALVLLLAASPVPAASRQLAVVESAPWDAAAGVPRRYERVAPWGPARE